ncbi:MAG: ATP-dependent RecD-like DNA helicase, partial [Helicobacter sp.]|nr:ATP-dependent RecD-like DNA helicase [Helicobacter sp.]
QWLENNNNLDSPEKIDYLKKLFTQSRLALIYGSAGTGKTTMIQYISDFFHDRSKLYLANTHTAINNLRRRIKEIENSDFATITAAKSKTTKLKKDLKEYEIVIIDECSTISNADMAAILAKIQPQVLICVGDIYQIGSIRFGNWFLFAKKLFSNIIVELKETYRTQDEKLKKLWGKVRMLEEDMLDIMVKEKCSKRLESFDFKTTCENRIILCLNYGGIYGINNVNRMLQENNKNPSHYFKGLIYKVGDPILFNEVERFDESLYNNLKGVITDIQRQTDCISFNIKVDKEITPSNEDGKDCFKIIKNGEGWTEVQLSVFEHSGDEDDKPFNAVPFQVAYAISIHKAQGLEYDNVAIIISDEIEEQITHNIFYTAITRAKKKLTIYWSPETEKKVLESLKVKDINRDYQLLNQNFKDIDNQCK